MKKTVFIIIALFISVASYSDNGNVKLSFDEAYKKAKEEPTNTYYLSSLASHYLQRKEFVQAADTFKKCVELDKKNSYYHSRLAFSYDKLERPDLAYSVLTNAFMYFPDDYWIASQLGYIEYKLGNFSNAIKAYNIAIKLTTNAYSKAYVYQGLGKSYRELGQFGYALANLNSALKIDKDFWIFYDIGKTYEDISRANKEDFTSYELQIDNYSRAKEMLDKEDKDLRELIIGKLASSHYYYAMALKDKNINDVAKRVFQAIIDDGDMNKTEYKERADFWLKRL